MQVALMAALAVAAPAHGQDAAVARAFAQASATFTQEMWVDAPAITAQIDARRASLAPCKAIGRDLARAGFSSSRSVYERATTLWVNAGWAAALAPTVAEHERFVAALDAIPTTDPRLRSGRAGWRKHLATVRGFAALPGDLCARLATWFRAGAKGTPLPDVQAVDASRFNVFTSSVRASLGPTCRCKIEHAEARMRDLGIPARDAHRFTGDPAYTAIEGPAKRAITAATGLPLPL